MKQVNYLVDDDAPKFLELQELYEADGAKFTLAASFTTSPAGDAITDLMIIRNDDNNTFVNFRDIPSDHQFYVRHNFAKCINEHLAFHKLDIEMHFYENRVQRRANSELAVYLSK